jgi:tRNA1Val (adenine37-N6)-methyltransferase
MPPFGGGGFSPMPNNYFRFKQFTVRQEHCAMKVCTDACIFGASVAVDNASQILDIGTGTGLLALMLAQRSEAQIDAVEIEESAFRQAQENFAASKWSNRLQIFHQSIQDFSKISANQYDLIVSNPPFFSNYLPTTDKAKNLALHSEQLSLPELLTSVRKLLSPQGLFWILLPEYEANQFLKSVVEMDLFLQKKCNVYNHRHKNIFRIIQAFSILPPKEKISSELVIFESNKVYTPQFRDLLKAYYLIF